MGWNARRYRPAMIALHGRYGILQDPLPAPERFVELRYARMAGIQ